MDFLPPIPADPWQFTKFLVINITYLLMAIALPLCIWLYVKAQELKQEAMDLHEQMQQWVEKYDGVEQARKSEAAYYQDVQDLYHGHAKAKRGSIPRWLRLHIIQRDKATCTYCNAVGTPESDPDGRAWNVDHVVPVARGGATNPHNLTLSCEACNLSKSDKTSVDFMKQRLRQGRWRKRN